MKRRSLKKRPATPRKQLSKRTLKKRPVKAAQGLQRKPLRKLPTTGGTKADPKPSSSVYIPRMNPRVKKMWVKALLSGEYIPQEKNTHWLRSRRRGKKTAPWKYTPLGVLCDLYYREMGDADGLTHWETFDSPTHDLEKGATSWQTEYTTLPEYIAYWAGLTGNPDPDRILVRASYTWRNGVVIEDQATPLFILFELFDFKFCAECIKKSL